MPLGNRKVRVRLSKLRVFAVLLIVGVSAWTLIRGEMLAGIGADSQTQHLASRALTGRIYRSGHLPLWNSYESSGVPLAALIQPGAFYLPNVLLYSLLPPVLAFNLSIAFHFLLMAFFSRRYLQTLGLRPQAVALGTAVLTLSGYMLVHQGVVPLFNAAVWVPAVFYCVEKFLRTGRWRYPAWGGLCLAQSLLAGWAQMLLLCSFYVCIYVMVSLPRVSQRRNLFLGLAAIFAITSCVALPQVVLTIGFRAYTHLERLPWSFFSSNSFPPACLLLLIFPNFFGPTTAVLYKPGFWWGPGDANIMAIYVGILPLLLAAAALPQWKTSRVVRFSIIALVVSLVMSFGAYTPIGLLLFHLPLFKFFRDHWVNLFFFSFGVGLLSAYATNNLQLSAWSDKARRIWFAAIPLGMIAVTAFTLMKMRWLMKEIDPAISPMGNNWFFYFHKSVKFDNAAVMIPVGLVLFFAAFFWVWTRHPESKRMAWWAVALIIADLSFFAMFYAEAVTSGHPGPAAQQLIDAMRQGAHGEPYRTIALDPGDVFLKVNLNALEGFDSVLGYEPFLPLPYADLLGMNTGGTSGIWPKLILNNRILSMLNLRYILARKSLDATVQRALPQAPPMGAENLLAQADWKPLAHPRQMGAVNIFQSDGKDLVGMFLEDVPVTPNTAYQFSFQAAAAAGPLEDMAGLLRWHENLDFCAMRRYELSAALQKTTCLYVTSPMQDTLAINFFTASLTPISVSQVNLMKIGPVSDVGSPYKLKLQAGDTSLFENQDMLPRAFFVQSLDSVPSYTEAKSRLWEMSRPLDLSKTALVQDLPNAASLSLQPGKVEAVDVGVNQVRVRASCPSNCFLVLADPYFPGWHAFLDGSQTTYYRTDAVLRGLMVPAGEHDITFRYLPKGLVWSFVVLGCGLAMAGALLLLDRSRIEETKLQPSATMSMLQP